MPENSKKVNFSASTVKKKVEFGKRDSSDSEIKSEEVFTTKKIDAHNVNWDNNDVIDESKKGKTSKNDTKNNDVVDDSKKEVSNKNDTKNNDITKKTTEIKTIDTPKKKYQVDDDLKDDSDIKEYRKNRDIQNLRREIIKNLLEHTGGNIPELYNKVNEELRALMKADQKLELKDIKFTEETAAFRIPKFAASFNLDGATDFFGMSIAEQYMLYDRVGLFKGIVIDHSKDTPVDQGYRNAVKYLKEENNNSATKPVAIFYKKPRLSGFFETNFSLDETQRKSQETGIFNLGFGLSVDYNYWATSAALRAGFSYGKEWLQEKNISVKKAAFISNFFLPKIELSFDTLKPCADDSLVEYLESIFKDTNTNNQTKFEKICTLLMTFGHFVPTSLVIGGRLYSSNIKKIEKMEEFDNVQTQYAASFQAAFSNMRTEVGVEGKMNHNQGSKASTSTSNESQTISFNAIGGEGAYVSDTEKWVKSTEKYTSWGLVRFDNLVPIIDLLPNELQNRCTQLFETITLELTIEQLLQRNAHFLFYSGYFEKFGKNAKPQFFVIKNIASSSDVLTIKSSSNNQELVSSTELELQSFSNQDSQLWYVSNSGKIYSSIDYDSQNKFVLSLENEKLVVTLEDYYPNQYWKLGGGRLSNMNNKTVTLDNKNFKLVETEKMVDTEITVVVPGKNAEDQPKTEKKTVQKPQITPEAMKSYWKIMPVEDLYIPKIPNTKKGTLIPANDGYRMLEKNFISRKDSLQSQDGNYKLCFEGNKLVIKQTKPNEKNVYERIVDNNVEKLALVNKRLQLLDKENQPISELVDAFVKEVNLLNNGNLEALESQTDKLIWHSNSMTYSAIKLDEKGVLSIHHQDFAPDMSHAVINVTLMPNIDADHQLWYLNSKNQLICKAKNANNIEFGLKCNENGELTMQMNPGISDDKSLQWELKTDGKAAIKNEKYGSFLTSKLFGLIISASASSSDLWEFKKKDELFGVSKIAKIVRPLKLHGDKDFCDLIATTGDRYVHTGWINVENAAEIKGVKIYKRDNRYALMFKDRNNIEYKDGTDSYQTFDINNVHFQKNPIYFNEKFDKVGFSSIGDTNHYGIETSKSGSSFKNNDTNFYQKMERSSTPFVDLNWAEAKEDEKVVGFGLGKDGNRLVPYLIVIPK
ncbi:hypothetical protein [Chryseobacterium sp. VD8]|uniref:hypothetical protein n=1 Tax=Chryseobacterium sp. VD8 TaxID=3081254 RepID=UPI003018D637